jgi:transcriptional regulator with XRE-family HTH domain
MKTVAERIKDARKAKGCTVEELAKACGITDSAVQMYECGQRVPRDSIKILMADYFGMTVQELFF